MADAAYLAWDIKRGATIYDEFTQYEEDGVTAMDISGWVGTCDVRKSVNSTEVLFSPAIGFVTDGTDGKWYRSVSATVSGTILSTATTLLESDKYWYDVRFNTGSTVEYPLQGDVNVAGTVTTS